MQVQSYFSSLDSLDGELTTLNLGPTHPVSLLEQEEYDFITKKLAEDKGKGKDGFDNQILETLRKQAEKVNIKY